jgi:hypothetical protein
MLFCYFFYVYTPSVSNYNSLIDFPPNLTTCIIRKILKNITFLLWLALLVKLIQKLFKFVYVGQFFFKR